MKTSVKKLTQQDYKKLWTEGLFIFDTNILFNLYRYSESSKEDLKKAFEAVKDRIWIPCQVYEEFNTGRPNVIENINKGFNEKEIKIKEIYSKILAQTNQIDNETSHHKYHKLINNINNEIKETKLIIDKSKEKIINLISEAKGQHSIDSANDPIFDYITELTKEKIGLSHTFYELIDLYKEAEFRYKNKIPPGYMDEKEKDNYSKYNDFVIWKQILNRVIELEKLPETKVSIVFITDDTKEDWYLKDKQNFRPELAFEISSYTNELFYICTCDKFMKNSNDYLITDEKDKITEESIAEAEAIREETLMNELIFNNFQYDGQTCLSHNSKEIKTFIIDNLDYIKRKMNDNTEWYLIFTNTADNVKIKFANTKEKQNHNIRIVNLRKIIDGFCEREKYVLQNKELSLIDFFNMYLTTFAVHFHEISWESLTNEKLEDRLKYQFIRMN